MSLETHIDLAKHIQQCNKSSASQREIMALVGWDISALLDPDAGHDLEVAYDFASIMPEQAAELGKIRQSNWQIFLDKSESSENRKAPIPLPDWTKQYIIWYNQKESNWESYRLLDQSKNWIPQVEYIWTFCDLLTQLVVTSILNYSWLPPITESDAESEVKRLQWMRDDYVKLLDKTLLGIWGAPEYARHFPDLIEQIDTSIGEAFDKIQIQQSQQQVKYIWKNTIIVTPQSYKDACHILAVEPGSSYAVAHKGYIRKLAIYHPDKIIAQVHETIPKKPKYSQFSWEDSFIEKLSQHKQWTISEAVFAPARVEYLRERVLYIAWELKDIVERVRANLQKYSYDSEASVGTFSAEFLQSVKSRYLWDDWRIRDQVGFSTMVEREYLMIRYHGATLEEYLEAKTLFQWNIAAWEELFEETKNSLGEVYAKNRDILMNAWDIFQAYQGMPWEQSKDIDIIYWKSKWWNNEPDLYNAIVLDRTDVLIAKWVLRKRWNLWERYVGYNCDAWTNDYWESYFYRMYTAMGKDIPDWLHHLVKLLEDDAYDPDAIWAQACKLRKSNFIKPENFDAEMRRIEEHPGLYSESYREYEFQPTLLFGQGRTWSYWLYRQHYALPIWLIFAHMYINMSGRIPYRLWEKFIKKYIPDADVHEINTILDMLADRIDGTTIIQPWTHRYEQEIEIIYSRYNISYSYYSYLDSEIISTEDKDRVSGLYAKINNCAQLAEKIIEIYQWPCIDCHACLGDHHSSSRIGIEIEKMWWLNIYFPINQRWYFEWKIDAIYFSQKEVSTMYLAMLWSPILDSMSDVIWRLALQK